MIMNSFFPESFIAHLIVFEQVFSPRQLVYFQAYMWALLFCEGRKCITRLARCCVFLDRSLSSWDRFLSQYDWDVNRLGEVWIGYLLKELKDRVWVHGALLLVVDTTFVTKVLGRMVGVQKWQDHSGNPDRGGFIIAHHWGLVGLVVKGLGQFICFPVLARLIPGHKQGRQWVSQDEGIRWMTFWDAVLAMIRQIGLYLGDLPFRVVVDGYFSNASFLRPMMEGCISVISRMAKNAVGWDDPVYKGRGRPPKRGKKWKLAELVKHFELKWVEVELYGKVRHVAVVVRDMQLKDLPSKVRIVVIANTASRPVILVSTDCTLTAVEIIECYGARFSIELTIRDLKQSMGFADYQCYSTVAIRRFVHLCLVSFGLWKLVALEDPQATWLTSPFAEPYIEETPLSLDRIKRAVRRLAIRNLLFSKTADDAVLEKVELLHECLLRIAA
jgi:hypothetical protein